jgi:hypothetical protein
MNSRSVKSRGRRFEKDVEQPNITFIHDLKKKVGPSRYKNTNKKTVAKGNKSRKHEKNKNSDTKNIDPGNPKKINMFNRTSKNSFGVK